MKQETHITLFATSWPNGKGLSINDVITWGGGGGSQKLTTDDMMTQRGEEEEGGVMTRCPLFDEMLGKPTIWDISQRSNQT